MPNIGNTCPFGIGLNNSLKRQEYLKQENIAHDAAPKLFFMAMGFLFILLQVAFHHTYLQYLPKFHGFGCIHHTHGAIMVSWMFMLVVQPYLIYKGKFKTHRLIGKISYFTASLMLISMFLATRLNDLAASGKIPFKFRSALLGWASHKLFTDIK